MNLAVSPWNAKLFLIIQYLNKYIAEFDALVVSDHIIDQ